MNDRQDYDAAEKHGLEAENRWVEGVMLGMCFQYGKSKKQSGAVFSFWEVKSFSFFFFI